MPWHYKNFGDGLLSIYNDEDRVVADCFTEEQAKRIVLMGEAYAVLEEFVQDCLAAHSSTGEVDRAFEKSLVDEWPDLLITFHKAQAIIDRLKL
jgi:hypothetical protein